MRVSPHRICRYGGPSSVVWEIVVAFTQRRVGTEVRVLKKSECTWLETFCQMRQITVYNIALDMYERVEREDEVNAVVLFAESETICYVKFSGTTADVITKYIITICNRIFTNVISY